MSGNQVPIQLSTLYSLTLTEKDLEGCQCEEPEKCKNRCGFSTHNTQRVICFYSENKTLIRADAYMHCGFLKNLQQLFRIVHNKTFSQRHLKNIYENFDWITTNGSQEVKSLLIGLFGYMAITNTDFAILYLKYKNLMLEWLTNGDCTLSLKMECSKTIALFEFLQGKNEDFPDIMKALYQVFKSISESEAIEKNDSKLLYDQALDSWTLLLTKLPNKYSSDIAPHFKTIKELCISPNPDLSTIARRALTVMYERDSKVVTATTFQELVDVNTLPAESIKIEEMELYVDSWYKIFKYHYFHNVLGAPGMKVHMLGDNSQFLEIFELKPDLIKRIILKYKRRREESPEEESPEEESPEEKSTEADCDEDLSWFEINFGRPSDNTIAKKRELIKRLETMRLETMGLEEIERRNKEVPLPIDKDENKVDENWEEWEGEGIDDEMSESGESDDEMGESGENDDEMNESENEQENKENKPALTDENIDSPYLKRDLSGKIKTKKGRKDLY